MDSHASSLDKKHCWHPFTAQREWCAEENDITMLVSGHGVWLEDDKGNKYIDGNSSIWTNIHGHRHPAIVQAMKNQLDRVAHTSYLGYAHPLAGKVAERLCSYFPANTLTRVFFSDDGSTAIECALKIERQYRLQTGTTQRERFLAFQDCYHGDTMGAASLGGVSAFFERFKGGMPVTHIRNMQELEQLPADIIASTAAVVIEPVIQGVNRMNVWPEGMLAELRQWTERNGIHLILDEVMTGFGRTGHMFACLKENVTPDYLCVAKGLTGGYTPMAATLTKEGIYEAFLNKQDDPQDNTFYYGHSFTAHQIGCAAALASLDIFRNEQVLEQLPAKIRYIKKLAEESRASNPHIGAVRQAGMVMGIDLVQKNGFPFPDSYQRARQACLAMKKYGLLTRPVLDTVVFMPPLCISEKEIRISFDAINQGITDACGQ